MIGGHAIASAPIASPATDTSARPAIANTILDPSGTPVAGVEVAVLLEPQRAFLSSGEEVARRCTATSSSTGVWQVEVPANTDLIPAGTSYRITERFSEDIETSWVVTLPDESTTLGALVSGN